MAAVSSKDGRVAIARVGGDRPQEAADLVPATFNDAQSTDHRADFRYARLPEPE